MLIELKLKLEIIRRLREITKEGHLLLDQLESIERCEQRKNGIGTKDEQEQITADHDCKLDAYGTGNCDNKSHFPLIKN